MRPPARPLSPAPCAAPRRGYSLFGLLLGGAVLIAVVAAWATPSVLAREAPLATCADTVARVVGAARLEATRSGRCTVVSLDAASTRHLRVEVAEGPGCTGARAGQTPGTAVAPALDARFGDAEACELSVLPGAPSPELTWLPDGYLQSAPQDFTARAGFRVADRAHGLHRDVVVLPHGLICTGNAPCP